MQDRLSLTVLFGCVPMRPAGFYPKFCYLACLTGVLWSFQVAAAPSGIWSGVMPGTHPKVAEAAALAASGSVDYPAIVRLLEVAARQGDATAHASLAAIYMDDSFAALGLYDEARARYHVKQAGDKGDPSALRMIGLMYVNQDEPDYTRADYYFVKASQAGNRAAPLDLVTNDLDNPKGKRSTGQLLRVLTHGERLPYDELAALLRKMHAIRGGVRLGFVRQPAALLPIVSDASYGAWSSARGVRLEKGAQLVVLGTLDARHLEVFSLSTGLIGRVPAYMIAVAQAEGGS